MKLIIFFIIICAPFLLQAQIADSTTRVQMIVIPDSFATRMQGTKVNLNVFNCIKGLDEKFYVSPNAITEFQRDFLYLKTSGWKADTILKYFYEFDK